MSTTTIHYWPDDVWCAAEDLQEYVDFMSDDYATITVSDTACARDIDLTVITLNRRLTAYRSDEEPPILNQDQPDFAAELSALMGDLEQDQRDGDRDERSVTTLLVLVIIAAAVFFGEMLIN